jgi:RNA polymerase sigma factor (TIGR02999 family)
MSDPAHDITQHLVRLTDGDSQAAADLLPLVYDELRALAASHFRRERPDHTLQPTALVHEAFLKLVNQTEARWQDRAHFFAVAAESIRRILIDHARRRDAQKRRRPDALTMSACFDTPNDRQLDLLALDAALTRLTSLNERQGRVVVLRFFGGMTIEETAEVLSVSPNTVKGDWRVARAWLQQELEEGATS